MYYSYPYILYIFSIIICLVIELSKKGNCLKNEIRGYCIFSYIVFLGCRGFIGWDWVNYYPFFLTSPAIGDVGYWQGISGFEVGFGILVTLVKTLFNNYFFLQLIIAIIYLFSVDKLIVRYSKLYSFSFLLFLIMGGFATQIDLLRNSISIALFLISIKYADEKKIIKYLSLNAFGFLFHTSSFVFLPLYFCLRRNIGRKAFFILFLIGNIIFLLQIQYLRPILDLLVSPFGGRLKYLVDVYLDRNIDTAFYGLSIGYIERLLTALLIFKYYDKLLKLSKSNIIFINLFILYFISFFYFGEVRIVTIRFSNLFTCSYWILYPALFTVILLNTNRLLLIGFIMLYSLFKMYGLSNLPIFKYSLFLFEDTNLNERNEQRIETRKITDN